MTDILATLRGIVGAVLPELPADDIGVADSLRDLGANSVDRMEILSEVIEAFDLPVSMIEIAGLDTLQQIADFVELRTAAGAR